MSDSKGENPTLAATIEAAPDFEDLSLTFTSQQQALYVSLSERGPDLAKMYAGALYVLNDPANPDRAALAAHGIRELMEKIPAFLDIETKAHKESLKAKVIELDDRWKVTLSKSECWKEQKWSGSIDVHLSRTLASFHGFFEWFTFYYPRRNAEIAKTLRGLDGSGRPLPDPLEKLNIQAWGAMRDFFQAVSHHGRYPTLEEYNSWLDALERFLLDRLRPRTFEDTAILDEILRGVGDND
jgi:hypothetical protein